jgi:hypothetical protein
MKLLSPSRPELEFPDQNILPGLVSAGTRIAMDEMEQLRAAASSLLQKAQDATVPELASAVEKATGVLRLFSDLEESRAEMQKLALEESKLRYENETAPKRERSERFREYVSLMTPIVTIVTLAATLSWQSWQFIHSEQDRREAAEDAQWADAVKVISQTGKLSPGVIALNPFLKSGKYGDSARDTAVQLLTNTNDDIFFDGLFGAAFVPVGWNNLNYLVKLDRALANRANPLRNKTWNATTHHNDFQNLDPQEKDVYFHLQTAMSKVCGQVGSLLKQPRPNSLTLDLSATDFSYCDLRGVDLSNTNIEGMAMRHVDLKNANLDRVTQFEGAFFYKVAWWEASKISPQFRAYLETNSDSKYDGTATYGPGDSEVTPQQYADALDRLKHQTP